MRIAVCNQHWATAGGGESYALSLAAALRRRGDVDLLGADDVEWGAVSDTLGIDVSGFGRRVVPFHDVTELRRVGSEYDLFVNTSWGSDLYPGGRHNVLVLHFPVRPERGTTRVRGQAIQVARRMRGFVPPAALFLSGFYAPEQTDRSFRWTDGDGVLVVPPADRPRRLEVDVAAQRPDPTDVVIEVAGRVAASAEGLNLDRTVTLGVELPPSPRTLLVRVRSSTFTPHELLGVEDRRRLGVQVLAVRMGVPRAARLFQRFGFAEQTHKVTWFRAYDRVIANSDFTQRWLQRWWGEEASVVPPAVTPVPRLEKEPIVVGVGRFFPPHRGHSKRQLELVTAFRRLVHEHHVPWKLHLVGGCQGPDEAYLRQVERAAEGLPVQLHVNASRAEVTSLLGRASIFWHATGLGEPSDAPERHEHFGIAVVEAMSAGAVPIVYTPGGPAEVVRQGVDGLHFSTIDGLVDSTRELLGDHVRLARFSAAAEARAENFTFAAMTRALDTALIGVVG